jgi:N-acetylneuraminic acid mutarotase
LTGDVLLGALVGSALFRSSVRDSGLAAWGADEPRGPVTRHLAPAATLAEQDPAGTWAAPSVPPAAERGRAAPSGPARAPAGEAGYHPGKEGLALATLAGVPTGDAAVLGLDASGSGRRGPQECAEGTWHSLASMPSRRQEISTAELGGKVYAIAGYNPAGQSTNTVEVYSPASNAWRSGTPLPIATNHNAAAVAAGRLYAFGGTSNRAFVYEVTADRWTDVAPMRYQHGNTPAVAVIDDRIYVAGGTGPGMQQNEVEVYDPLQNTWTTLAPMNVPRNHTAGAAIGGKFYVAGGRDSPAAHAALEVYDPKTNVWSRLADMPTGRSGLAGAAVNGCFYTFGGELPRLFDNVEVYNPATDAWQQLAPMRTPRHGIYATVLGSAVYLPGGATQQGFGATDVNEVYVIGRNAVGGT